ncbi:MAG TPA: PrgI family protein [Patescibacteria group bacterium]|nr:PrgI family protein [Patescibacteria group bacterium]
MPEKFVVPQFIDNEDKILGPITVRQFLICLGATLVIFIEYAIFRFAYFIIAALITAGIAAVFAFVKVNGQPFHIFFINFLQSFVRPPLRVWHKELPDSELRVYLTEPAKPIVKAEQTKTKPESTRLRDLALTVNTGGVYNMEE